jgi:tartrate-resistant acid phosphatase type 5
MRDQTVEVSRRRFLRESFAWSALAAMPALRSAAARPPDPRAAHALAVGDWGWSEKPGAETSRNGNGFEAQRMVAHGMDRYARTSGVHPDGLCMLGDNWYGDLAGGAVSPWWLEKFERMYPLETFACPVYSMLGNHDYQMLPPEVD